MPATATTEPTATTTTAKPRQRKIRRSPVKTREETAAAIAGLAYGLSVNKTAAETGMARDTVNRIAQRNPGPLAETRARVAYESQAIAELALVRVREALPDASALQAMTVAGIAVDKSLLLTGDAKGMGDAYRVGTPTATTQNIQINVTEASPVLAHALTILFDGSTTKQNTRLEARKPTLELVSTDDRTQEAAESAEPSLDNPQTAKPTC